ncbi:hypothetical protein EAS64_06435 [Trebonia kvetii]|uniref:Uncharacterized protein n=1 Tax=Trebonia kvetii TaxID=2480626 RepID=A0A6P2CBI6_9ACTN|nr:hypothetical protein [Trebonia kvetii]TVZ06963.1 hypothetical protein EAS64_06435 [Trebonia kvetii]
MEHDGKSRRWRMPRVLGAAALAAGLLAVGLPAGAAQASTVPTSPGASTTTQYSLDFVGSAKTLGHTWIVDFNAGNDAVGVLLSTTYKGVSEQHQWMTTAGYGKTAAKELKVTSTGHASFATGKTLSPVLSVTAAFAPTKATKSACTKGSETVYTGKVTGSLTLVTGLKSVKVKLKFSGKAGASLDVDKSCQPKIPPVKTPCAGSGWFVTAANNSSNVLGAQTPGSKTWQDLFAQGPFKTASKWVQRSALVAVNGPAPKVSTASKTVAVSGLASGAITGAGLISYSSGFASPPVTCYIGSKKYKATTTEYFGSVKVSKPFKANTALAGTLTAKTPTQGFYNAVKLVAA